MGKKAVEWGISFSEGSKVVGTPDWRDWLFTIRRWLRVFYFFHTKVISTENKFHFKLSDPSLLSFSPPLSFSFTWVPTVVLFISISNYSRKWLFFTRRILVSRSQGENLKKFFDILFFSFFLLSTSTLLLSSRALFSSDKPWNRWKQTKKTVERKLASVSPV